jgi:hypothetical protein
MLALHEHAVLASDNLQGVLESARVHLQPERVRLTPMALTIEDLSKLWTAVQSSYRLSVAYEASVLLIGREGRGRSPLPVLRRGRRPVDDAGRDEGVRTLASAGPVLRRAWTEAWGGDPSFPARSGDRVVLEGRNLSGGTVDAVFHHPRITNGTPIVAPARAGASAARVVVDLPAALPPGFVTVAARITRGADDPPLVSNAVALAVAARIGPIAKQPPAGGEVVVDVQCDRLAAGQSVVLLVGDRQHPAVQPVPATRKAMFKVGGLPSAATRFTVRVRVDGVDSIPLVDPVAGKAAPTAFDPSQTIRLP